MNIINAILNLSILFSGGGDLDTSKINGGGFVPAWAKEVVWYQIFPERFRNGDPSNDPKVEDTDGAYPHDITSPWEIHPWGSDWYKLRPYETENGKSIWFNIQRRRYGGDLQGIIDKLDYLQDLGITALYLNPVFTSPSLHKYDGVTFHHIDPNFGPDPEGDRRLTESEVFDDPSTWVWTSADKLALLLIEEAHKRGMKIIFDGVFNHMGIKSVPFEDVVKNQQKSRYADWFSVKSWDDPEKGSKFEYEGWFGVKELPEIKEDENGIVAGPKKYIFDITKRWMAPNGDPSKGINGWRLDVAFCIQHKFWKDWRKEVKAINPEAYITAEVIDTISVVKEYLGGDEFDAVMNYNFGFAAADFIVAEKTRIPATAFAAMMEDLVTAFPGGVPYVQQNLFGSHDANRIGSHIVNRDLARYRYWGNYFNVSKGDNPSYNTRKPDAAEKQIQKLFVILQMTSVGAPMIYYGDEAGMWGANDPDCRKPMIWDDIRYEDETTLPDQSAKPAADKVETDHDLLAHYKKLIKIRNENKALQTGDFKTVLADDDKELYGFERTLNSDKIIVIINVSSSEQSFDLSEHSGTYTDLISGSSYNQCKGSIPARWGVVLKRN